MGQNRSQGHLFSITIDLKNKTRLVTAIQNRWTTESSSRILREVKEETETRQDAYEDYAGPNGEAITEFDRTFPQNIDAEIKS